MTWYTRALKDKAIYWANPVAGGYGNKSFDDPEEISCRWEEKQELFLDPRGEEKMSNAVVFVNQNMEVGEFLMLGELTDLASGEETPRTATSAYEIRQLKKVRDIRGRQYVRKVYL